MGILRWKIAAVLKTPLPKKFVPDPKMDSAVNLANFLSSEEGKAALEFLATTGKHIWLGQQPERMEFVLTGKGLVKFHSKTSFSEGIKTAEPASPQEATDAMDWPYTVVARIKEGLDILAKNIIFSCGCYDSTIANI